MNFISIFKRGNKIVVDDAVLSNKYILESNSLKPISDSNLINSHIACEFKDCACRINSFVWVSKKKKAIWFEVPKSASRSLLCALNLKEPSLPEIFLKIIAGYSGGITIYYDSQNVRVINKCLRIIKLYNYSGLNLYAKKDFQLKLLSPNEVIDYYSKYYSFAIIRNPYERMVSNYKMFTEKEFRFEKIKMLIGIPNSASITFEDFIDFTVKYNNHHWEKQIKYLPLDLNRLSYLGSMNNLENDWKIISKKLKINNKLPILNSTQKSGIDITKYYNKYTFDLVTNYFNEDIKLFSSVINEDISNNLGRQFS